MRVIDGGNFCFLALPFDVCTSSVLHVATTNFLPQNHALLSPLCLLPLDSLFFKVGRPLLGRLCWWWPSGGSSAWPRGIAVVAWVSSWWQGRRGSWWRRRWGLMTVHDSKYNSESNPFFDKTMSPWYTFTNQPSIWRMDFETIHNAWTVYDGMHWVILLQWIVINISNDIIYCVIFSTATALATVILFDHTHPTIH